MGVPEIKQKVLTATSNDAWGPTGQQMREIADATHHYAEFGLIMESIWERLNEPGKYWRHVYKALLLLDYLLKNGADQCVREARVKMIEIKTLTEFQHIDDKDKDQGLSVRERAKAIVELLHDERRLNEERSKARANRDKYTNAISSDQARYGGSYGGGGGGGGGGRSYQSKRPTGPPSYVDEQDFEPPSRTSPGVGSTYGGSRTHSNRNNDLSFSSGDDMDDEFPDYQSPAARQPARQPARQDEPPRPAPAPAPLIDLLGAEPARPAPTADPNAGFFTAAVPPQAGFSFPGAAPTPQFGGFAQTAAPTATGGFPGGFPSAAPASAGFGGFPTATPVATPGGFPSGPGPAPGGFSMPTATPTTTPSTTPTPAFFQPAPGSSEADWSEFQGSAGGRAPEPAKAPEPAVDPSDPWARNDLFSFSKDKPAATTASTVKKTPMGAAGVKPTLGAVPSQTAPGNPNMFGMAAPTVVPGYPGYGGQPQPGFGMVAAPGGFGMTAPVAGGFGMAAPAGYGMAAPAGYGMTPGMPGVGMPMAGGMGMMGAYPGYGQR